MPIVRGLYHARQHQGCNLLFAENRIAKKRSEMSQLSSNKALTTVSA
jgi:hypothetical protein